MRAIEDQLASRYPNECASISAEGADRRRLPIESFAEPASPGLGIEVDRAALEAANALYKQHGLGARDDAIACASSSFVSSPRFVSNFTPPSNCFSWCRRLGRGRDRVASPSPLSVESAEAHSGLSSGHSKGVGWRGRNHRRRPSLKVATLKSANAFTRRCKCTLAGQARTTVRRGTGLAIGRMTSGSPS